MRKEILALITIFLFATNLSAQCTGSEFCSTCSNCSKCKHCRGNGFCGACEPERFKVKEKKQKENSKTIISAKTIRTKEQLVNDKKEFDKVKAFVIENFGANYLCSASYTIGNCSGYECPENNYSINDGTKNIIEISSFKGPDFSGNEFIITRFLKSNTNVKAYTLEKAFDKIKEEIEKKKIAESENKLAINKTSSNNSAPEVFTIVEEQAEFPGGIAQLGKFIQNNLKYPTRAKEGGISGKCFSKFIINEDGKISDVKILKGVSECPDCDDEAIRVILSMPLWKPAKLHGKSVKSYFNLPIAFKL